jgi:N utilization substance protein A
VYLFENEVPEIQDGTVRIVAVAREAVPPSRHVGPRTKIAVDTLERDVDPVGACIGARGSRIQVVVNELRGEKIDVIRWSPDPATYISNALSPAKVEQLYLVDPEERQAHVLVAEDQLSLAIGKDGQNVRLAAKLTGWKIDIKDTAKYSTEDSSPAMQRQRSQPSKRLSGDFPAPGKIDPETDEDAETMESESEIQSKRESELGSKVGSEIASEIETGTDPSDLD